jgi:hypothetical protein
MQNRVWIIIVFTVTLVIVLAACQNSTQTPVSNNEEVSAPTEPPGLPIEQEKTPTIEPQSYPEPEQPYPAPGSVSSVYNPYPGPSDGVFNYVDWSQAEAVLLKGEVTEVYQTHTLHVTLVLTNGNIILAIEPELDEVINVVERCGDLCKDVILATE